MARDNDYISSKVRELIAVRAGYRCEYCLLPENKTGLACEVDHIIGIKHGGANLENNLAYAWPTCNRNKGSDIASIDWNFNQVVRLFNPRTDLWSDIFNLSAIVLNL